MPEPNTGDIPTEHPITFPAPEVRAILAGLKSQFRQPITARNSTVSGYVVSAKSPGWTGLKWDGAEAREKSLMAVAIAGPDAPTDVHISVPWKHDDDADCGFGDMARYRVRPRWEVGDRLWVKEAWRCNHLGGMRIEYKAGGACLEDEDWPERTIPPYALPTSAANVGRAERQLNGEKIPDAWRPSIHLPRWAARLVLEVADVRVQRLQEITEEDARAEAATSFIGSLEGRASDLVAEQWCRWTKRIDPGAGVASARGAFATWWERTHGRKPEDLWAANGWVWATTFRRIEGGGQSDA